MNLRRWLSVILTMGLILAFNPLSAQAGPHHRPYRDFYGWDGPRHPGFDRHYRKHFRPGGRGPHHPHYVERVYGGPPVAYVAPVAPIVGIPYAPPQPYYSQPATPGFSGTLQYNF